MSIVLLPGTLCDERVFAAMAPGLAAPRLLDHRPYDRVEAAADALLPDVPPGSLGVAFSLGGWVLLAMLARDPARFRGLVLLAGNAFPDASGNAAARRAEAAAARAAGYATLARDSWRRAAGSAAAPDPAGPALLRAMAEACGPDVHVRQAEMNIHRPDLRAVAAASPVPLLAIAGAEDPLCPAERYAQVASAPGARLVSLPGVGHYVPIEAPGAALAAIVARFPEARA